MTILMTYKKRPTPKEVMKAMLPVFQDANILTWNPDTTYKDHGRIYQTIGEMLYGNEEYRILLYDKIIHKSSATLKTPFELMGTDHIDSLLVHLWRYEGFDPENSVPIANLSMNPTENDLRFLKNSAQALKENLPLESIALAYCPKNKWVYEVI